MQLHVIVRELDLSVLSAEHLLDRPVGGGYVSDLLSDVLANCRQGDIWITLHVHPNIVAVASLKGVAAVVLSNGREPQDETLQKARQENLPILVSDLSTFELAGRIYKLLNEKQ